MLAAGRCPTQAAFACVGEMFNCICVELILIAQRVQGSHRWAYVVCRNVTFIPAKSNPYQNEKYP